jgi:hypothetical protein
LARDRAVEVASGGSANGLAALVPGGTIERGSVLRVAGEPGAGSTTVTFELAAAFTALGEWAAVVDLDGTLLDGVSLVVAEIPRGVGLGDARRLVARAREREAVLVAYERRVPWPAEARFVVHADASAWTGLGCDAGFLAGRRLRVRVEGRGAASRPRVGELARAV